jgi:hypothetical protein
MNHYKYNIQSDDTPKVSLIRDAEVVIKDYVIGSQPANATNPELWSFYHMQNQVSTLINDFNALKQNPVPIGFIYVQLPNQPDPKAIWPNVQQIAIHVDWLFKYY